MPQADANGLKLEYETFGKPTDPAMLLIMGLGGQMVLWPDTFCENLARAGHYVIRFDNRDVGLSSRIESAPRTRLLRAGIAYTLGLRLKAPYRLDDMAADALGLLDALKIDRAHVVGVSMGGMIAQILAARHPERVLSLTSIMSSSGDRRLPGPSLKLRLRLVRKPPDATREAMIERSIGMWRLIGSPGYPVAETELRARMTHMHDRASYPRGVGRQTLAIMASGSRVPLLGQITAPTLVIHGAADPLVPVAAAADLGRRIRGARVEIIEGMGHDLPAPLLPKLARLILDHVGRGRKEPTSGESEAPRKKASREVRSPPPRRSRGRGGRSSRN